MIETTINKISTIKSWYNGIPRDFSDISTLLYTRKALSCAIFDLGIHTGEAVKAYEQAEGRRKFEFSNEFNSLCENHSGQIAKEKANILIKDLIEKEKDCKAIVSSLKIILETSKNLLDAMAAQIRFLEDERKRINFSQNT